MGCASTQAMSIAWLRASVDQLIWWMKPLAQAAAMAASSNARGQNRRSARMAEPCSGEGSALKPARGAFPPWTPQAKAEPLQSIRLVGGGVGPTRTMQG